MEVQDNSRIAAVEIEALDLQNAGLIQ